ncbi:AGRG2 protein, partial [Amia calva]|nr:AGRG2 protein [Amia calva]
MGLEAIQLYRMLWLVFNTYTRHYLLKLCLLGWGLPACVVLIIVAVNPGNYGPVLDSGSSMCWITNMSVKYSTIIGYFAILMLFNGAILISVVTKMVLLKSLNNGNKKRHDCRATCSVLGLTCGLGLTWGLGFFSMGYTNLPIIYAFCILNSFQGFFLFLWICFIRFQQRIPLLIKEA